MRNLFFLTFLIVLLSCVSDGKKAESKDATDTISMINNFRGENLNNPEKEYLRVRDEYIKYFKNIDFEKDTNVYKKDQQALAYLENRLREILRNANVKNISKDGKINLETLTGDLGFGMLDGLKLEIDSLKLFYTSRTLFDSYFDERKLNPIDKLTSNELQNILNSTFYSDATVLDFSSLKMNTTNNIHAYGILAMATQEIGPYLPENLFVLILKEEYIYMIEKHMNSQIVEIPGCKRIWDSINLLAEQEFDKYKLSKFKDTLALKKNNDFDQLAMDKYCNCYQQNLIAEKQFEPIKKQLEQMIHIIY